MNIISITVLVFTAWCHVQGTTDKIAMTRSILAPDHSFCEDNKPALLKQVRKEGFSIIGKKIVVDQISGVCLTFEKPVEA